MEVCLVGVLPLPRQLSRQGEMYVSPCILVVQGREYLDYELGVRHVDSKQIFNYVLFNLAESDVEAGEPASKIVAR